MENERDLIKKQIDNNFSKIEKNRKKTLFTLFIGFVVGLITGFIALWFYNLNIGIFVFGGVILGAIYSHIFHQPHRIKFKDLPKISKKNS